MKNTLGKWFIYYVYTYSQNTLKGLTVNFNESSMASQRALPSYQLSVMGDRNTLRKPSENK